jgi:hypothetical protein
MVDQSEPVLPLGSFLFPRISQAFRLSIQPSKLAIAFLALATICLTGWVMDLGRSVVVADSNTAMGREGRLVTLDRVTELDIYVLPGASLASFMDSARAKGGRTGVFASLWTFGAERFHGALYSLFALDVPGVIRNVADCIKALIWAFRYHPIYSVIFFAIALAALSLAGGAICRIAALQFAQAQRPGLVQAVRFSARRFASLFTAPITPIVMILAIGLLIILLGLIGNIPVAGELMVGLFLPVALLVAVLIAVILIGTLAGLNLMAPAVAYEDSDSFEAICRSFSYVYARPWRMGFYTVIAVICGAICYVFVRFFAFLLLWIAYRFLQAGFWQHNEKLRELWSGPTFGNFFGTVVTAPDTWSMWLGTLLIRIWILAVIGLVVSFLISYYFSAHTIIYALIRHRVDKTPLNEVYIPSAEPTAKPAARETPCAPADSESEPEAPGDSEQKRGTSE